ncbi:MAG: RNA 2',3'-cyclic phosphodiesterase [Deltaproteobacteria bacterium]|nr:RNA 2',3'-cyclic phosphodiesterase [Deltaproteobacteria bacterium]
MAEKSRVRRLFVALIAPKELALKLAALAPANSRPEKLIHLTLKFIGEVSLDQAARLTAALATVKAPAFTLKVQGLGLFAHGPFWAGVDSPPELISLIKAVDLIAQEVIGLKLERWPPKPHLTIARVKGNPDPRTIALTQKEPPSDFGSFWVRSFSLWESFLEPSGARRVLVQEYPLI